MPARALRIQPKEPVPEGWVRVDAVKQMKDGSWYRLRGNAYLQTSAFLLTADTVDYNEETGDAVAHGNVHLQHFTGGEELWAAAGEYNVDEETGRFWEVRGSSPVRIEARPGVLTSSNPFYFEGKWAERLKEKYILHDGFITNCKMPKPWWILRGPTFDIIPDKRAIAYRTVFRLRRVPIFYAPAFYKSLERMPRKSGFLTPNIGNSSRRGKMVGGGYYWAINRSYDAMYRGQYFTGRGIAHNVDVRGKPNGHTDFNTILYGVNDRGRDLGDGVREKQGGLLASFTGRSELGRGFYARAEVNYLSSLVFRQNWTESFNEAITSEVHSVGFLSRDWSTYSLDLLFQRNENFQTTLPDDTIVVRKLPEASFTSRDRRIWRSLPLWVSWESSAGLLRRKQLLFQTRQFLERADFYPRVMTALRWKDFNVLPSFAVRETHWGESQSEGRILGANINRSAREFSLAIAPPSFARIYNGPSWFADKLKHVIEPRLSYTYVTGVNDFHKIVRFDETELYSNTNEAEISVVNRLYAKRRGAVEEVLSWEVFQKRYFDPGFGGAVASGWCGEPVCRNVVLSGAELTPYAFLDRPRHYSPVVSVLRMSPRPGFGLQWRADYDPLRGQVVNSGLAADARFGKYFVTVGENSVRSVPQLTPPANQFSGTLGIGDTLRRGWNAAFNAVYDFRVGTMPFATAQVSYNTDCCGFSIQYRRLGFRNDNVFRVAFAVANLGSFGTLKKQERIF